MFEDMSGTLRLARAATFAFFTLCGFTMGMWVVHIPVVEQRVGVSHAVLGWLLLLLGGGAFLGMQVVGPLIDRVGPRVVVPVGGVLASLTLILPGLATDAWMLGAALLAFGFCSGCLDVSMNVHAVQVERGYRRPIMSAFHATFSVGGVIAALLGARTLSWGWSPVLTLSACAAVGLLLTAVAAPALLRVDRTTGAPEPTADPRASAGGRRRIPRSIWALAVLAFALMLCEGVANDWSALEMRDVLGTSAATAAFAYGAFAATMTIGRFLTDRIAGRFGPVAILRYGGTLAAVALATVALSPWVPLTIAGWAAYGIGLAGCVPQLFSAAGHTDPAAAGVNVARVSGIGYLGMLAGPAIIGPLTHLVPLNHAFFLPVALAVIAAAAATLVRPGASRRREEDEVVPATV